MASLKELQQALAATLTASRPAVEQHQAQDLLADFNIEELQQSRETLVRKRLLQIASLLPKTQASLHSDYQPWCRAFIDGHHFQGVHAPQLDAIHFARWLRKEKPLQRWQREVAYWEALRIEWGLYACLFRIKKFHYDFALSTVEGIVPSLQSSLWIAIRLGRWGVFRRL